MSVRILLPLLCLWACAVLHSPAVLAFVLTRGPNATGGSGGAAASPQWVLDASEFNAAAYNLTATAAAAGSPVVLSTTDAAYIPRCGDVYFCNSTADVVAAATAATAGSVALRRLQARSGRHSYLAAGATTRGAAVIDVSNITHVRLSSEHGPAVTCGSLLAGDEEVRSRSNGGDEGCRAVHVGPGVRLFDLYERLDALGLFFPGGTCPTVAVGGFTLGGGYGLWSRTLGLAINNVIAVTIVRAAPCAAGAASGCAAGASVAFEALNVTRVANGKRSGRSDAENDEELFEALLGAGNNNFGIVTDIVLRAFPKPRVVSQWRLNIAEAGAVAALGLFRASVTRDWNADLIAIGAGTYRVPLAGSQSLSVTLDHYGGGAAAIVVGVNVSAAGLASVLRAAGWLDLPGGVVPSPAAGPTELPWLTGVAATQGCATLEQCRDYARFMYPNPTNPSRWVALSSYQYGAGRGNSNNASSANGHADVAFDRAMGRRPQVPGLFAVAILDAYGGAINASGWNAASAFPHHDAAFHVQVMNYIDGNVSHADMASGWALEVLAVLDAAAAADGRLPTAYRNYPSLLLPQPLSRYFGWSSPLLARLARVKRRMDPLGLFDQAQGIPAWG